MRDEPLHILLIRHGQTDANKTGIVQGHQPTPLNALGRRQAELVAARLAGQEPPVEHLVCSDLLRAVQTAEPVARMLNLTPVYERAWRERGYGQFEGLSPHQRLELRQQINLMDADPPPGAQGKEEFQEQIRGALLHIPSRFPEARCVAVVTHGGACRAVLMMLADGRLPLGSGSVAASDEITANGSITYLICRRDQHVPTFDVIGRNDTEHLDEIATLTDVG